MEMIIFTGIPASGKSSFYKELFFKLTQAEKNELLFQYGINYNTLPSWQKRGVGIYNKEVVKPGFNPATRETVDCLRNDLFVEKELGIREEYRLFLKEILKCKN